MRRSTILKAALSAAVLGASVVSATAGGAHHGGGAMMRPPGAGVGHPGFGGRAPAYRPLPPVSGTLRPGPHGIYGDRSFGRVHYAGGANFARPMERGYGPHAAASRFAERRGGAGIYDLGRGERRGFGHRFHGTPNVVYGGGYAGGGYGVADAGYAGGGYDAGMPPATESYAEGTPSYENQGFSPVAGTGYGPVTYQQTAGYGSGYGYGAGGGLGVYVPGAYSPGPSIISIPDHYNVGYTAHSCGCHGGGLFN